MIDPQQIFAARYRMERLLGLGGFSEVWLAHDLKTEVEVAIKIYAPSTGLDEGGLKMFAHGFPAVMDINHQNLLKPIYYDDYERQPYLVLPYCKGGSVKNLIGNLAEKEIWKIIRDVASGLAYLHAMQPPIVHQCIKPSNIMIGKNGEYLISDFWGSTVLRAILRRSQVGKNGEYDSAGTIAYMAPERFSRQNKPIIANDIYSLGATIFELLTGDAPFGNLGGIIYHQGADLPEIDSPCSDQLKQVVEHCLAREPWDRPEATQLEKWAQTAIAGGTIDFNRPSPATETAPVFHISGNKEDLPISSTPPISIGTSTPDSEADSSVQASTPISDGSAPAPTPLTGSASRPTERKSDEPNIEQNATSEEGVTQPPKRYTPQFNAIYNTCRVALIIIVIGFLAAKKFYPQLFEHKNTFLDTTFRLNINYILHSGWLCSIAGHKYVDLGLSVKWATCNIGANSPEEYGDYFAWGETTTKSTYTEDNSKTYGKDAYNRDIGGDASLDAARANWGGTWRLPTEAEFQELIDNCTWTWTTQGGHNGYEVTSKKNGNSIFLSAAGSRYGSSLDRAGELGIYWSSSPNGSDNTYARILGFNSSTVRMVWNFHGIGQTVRPVSK